MVSTFIARFSCLQPEHKEVLQDPPGSQINSDYFLNTRRLVLAMLECKLLFFFKERIEILNQWGFDPQRIDPNFK